MYVEDKPDGDLVTAILKSNDERFISVMLDELDHDAAATLAEIRARWRKQVLDAADYIETHGWQRGSYSGPDGAVCIMGALWHAATGRVPRDDEEEPPLAVQSLEACVLQTLKRRRGLAGWNDHYSRTQRQVTNALRRAAAKLDDA